MSTSRTPSLIIFLACCLALLGGCGSDDGGEDTRTTSERAGSERGAQDLSQEQAEAEREEAAILDTSVRRFGAEATGSTRDEMLSAARSYLTAVGAGDFAAACRALSETVVSGLRDLAAGGAPTVCRQLLKGLLEPEESRRAERAAHALVTHVRSEDGRGFVIFKPAGERVSYLPLLEGKDGWRLASLAVGILLRS
ncbi:MAG TPA: hypothetical protein VNM38_08150 [Solirubrobacterales bacterium]|nr:hypothetical protein [Solirubrobacterales bacterium]